MISAWNGKNKTLLLFCSVCAVLCIFSGCDDHPEQPGEGFYSYRGFRDWWRVPLKFPYQITMIDGFELGALEKYDPASLVADPKCETVAEDITEIGYDARFAVFRRKNAPETLSVLIYTSGSVRDFGSPKELAEFIARNWPGVSVPEMMKLEKFHDLMWRALDGIRKTNPRKLAY